MNFYTFIRMYFFSKKRKKEKNFHDAYKCLSTGIFIDNKDISRCYLKVSLLSFFFKHSNKAFHLKTIIKKILLFFVQAN